MADKKTAPKQVTLEGLEKDLVKLQEDHLESRKSHRQGELVNPHILTTQRKSIARLHTAINAHKKEALKEEN